MTEILTYITEYGDSLSVVGVLLIVLSVVTYGLYRRWWVPGWMYQEIVKERDELQGKVDTEADRIRLRLEMLEEQPRTRQPRR